MRQTPNIKKIQQAFRLQKKLSVRVWLPKAVLGLCLFFIGLGSAFPSLLLAEPPSTLSLSMHNQQFSAYIIRAPLEKVLATLTSYVPIRFFINGSAKNELISASFSNFPLEKALEHLLIGYDYAILAHRLETTPQTSEFRYLTEVEVISRNPAEPSSHSKGTYSIPSRRTSVQPTPVQANQTPEIQDQGNPFGLETAPDAGDFQATLEEGLQGDPEARTLVEKLMQEIGAARE